MSRCVLKTSFSVAMVSVFLKHFSVMNKLTVKTDQMRMLVVLIRSVDQLKIFDFHFHHLRILTEQLTATPVCVNFLTVSALLMEPGFLEI